MPIHFPHAQLGAVTLSAPIIAMDFLKVDRCADGYEYILVIADHFPHHTKAYPTRNKSGKTAAEKLLNDFIVRFEIPHRILQGQRGEFEDCLFKELHQYLRVKNFWTTSYHAMCNRMVERMNSALLRSSQPRGVPRKRCSENMQRIHRRTPMPKCDFNKVAKQLY